MRVQSLFMVLLASGAVWAQGTNSQQLEKKPLQGFVPTANFAVSDIETINTSNGNLLLHIPLVSLPAGRGGMPGPGITMLYNSKSLSASATVHYVYGCTAGGEPVLNATYLTYRLASETPWRYAGYGYSFRSSTRDEHTTIENLGCAPSNLPLQCDSGFAYRNWKYEMEFPDGSTHVLVPRGYENSPDGYVALDPLGYHNTCPYPPDQALIRNAVATPMRFYTIDGTFARLDLNRPIPGQGADDWTLYFADGRKVVNQPPGAEGQRVYDRNGNYYEVINAAIPNTASTTTTIRDAVGRSIILTTRFGMSGTAFQDVITATGFNDVALTWQVWSSTVYSSLLYQPYLPGESFGAQPTPPNETLNSAFVVKEIQLPGQIGGHSYKFSYGGDTTTGTGVLRQLDLESSSGTQVFNVNYNYALEDSLPLTSPPSFQTILDSTVTKKTLSYSTSYPSGSVSSSEIWLYNLPNTQFGSAVITAPDGGITKHYQTFGLNYRTELPDGSRIEQVWKENPVTSTSQSVVPTYVPQDLTQYIVPKVNPYVASEYNTLAGTSTRIGIKQTVQDQNGNAVETDEYDFATNAVSHATDGQPTGVSNASLVRTVTRGFSGSPPASPNACNSGNFYCNPSATRSIFNLPDWQLTGGTSRAEYCYDGKGNLTLEAKGPNATLANCTTNVAEASALTQSQSTYDGIYGNRVTTVDARGAITRYLYGAVGGVSNLYPTQVALAEATPEQHVTTFAYDFATGLVSSTTDANNVTTTTDYDAPGRPKSIARAGTKTRFEYYDQDRYVIRRTDMLTANDGMLVEVNRFDPLGRLRLRQQLEVYSTGIPSETIGIRTETRYRYDSTGEYMAESTPYRDPSDPNYDALTRGWKVTRRDQMGRVQSVTSYNGAALPSPFGSNYDSSGAVVSTYDGASTTVKDETLKERTTSLDALGRLQKVVEGVLGRETWYRYNVLDNLLGVCQGSPFDSSGNCTGANSLGRSFSYDVLGRLTQATNPESGSVSYNSYDGNGNLLQKTDARGAIVAWDPYDKLNRPTRKSYSGTGIPATPAVTYSYDTCTYGRGRLCSVGTSISTSSYQYDELGRVARSTQNTEGNPYSFGDPNDPAKPGYEYNLAGGLNVIHYPSGRVVNYGLRWSGPLESSDRLCR